MKPLRLYVRTGCHLCEDMLAELQPILKDREVLLVLVDVDSSADILEDYGNRIPVLETLNGECLSECFLDIQAVANYLEGG